MKICYVAQAIERECERVSERAKERKKARMTCIQVGYHNRSGTDGDGNGPSGGPGDAPEVTSAGHAVPFRAAPCRSRPGQRSSETVPARATVAGRRDTCCGSRPPRSPWTLLALLRNTARRIAGSPGCRADGTAPPDRRVLVPGPARWPRPPDHWEDGRSMAGPVHEARGPALPGRLEEEGRRGLMKADSVQTRILRARVGPCHLGTRAARRACRRIPACTRGRPSGQ